MADKEIETRVYTAEDLKSHNKEKDCWLAIHGKVYNVTDFLEEHPGGFDVVVSASGRDATEDFDEIGHSKKAREMLDKYLVGDYAGGDASPSEAQPSKVSFVNNKPSDATRVFHILLPLLLILVALGINIFLGKK